MTIWGRARRLRPALAALATLLVLPQGAAAASKPPVSKPQILAPARGAESCAGPTSLVGRERNARLTSKREPSRWSHSVPGRPYVKTPGDEAPTAAYSPPNYHRLTDTSNLPSGKVRLRLKLGRGSSARTASTQFRNNLPPVVSPVQSLTTSTPNDLQLAVDAFDPEAGPLEYKWYLGDGTIDTGPVVNHRFANGDYVVMLEVTDANGCRTLRVVLLHVPQQLQVVTLSEIDWCDPIDASVNASGRTKRLWQAPEYDNGMGVGDPNRPATPKDLGRLNTGEWFGYFFEAEMKVFGHPARCLTDQSVRVTDHWEVTKDGEDYDVRYVLPKPKGVFSDRWAFDGYNDRHPPRVRRLEPSPAADGTATIAWIDFPAIPVKFNRATNAQVNAEFLSRVSGQEAPINHDQVELLEGLNPGDETAFIHFRLCAALKPPKDRTDQAFKVLRKEGPDAPEPPEVMQRARPDAFQKTEHRIGKLRSEITGCGQKP